MMQMVPGHREEALLRVEDLVVKFPTGFGRSFAAVCGVSFEVARGETLGLVGESGCGKSSLARAIMQLPAPASGRVLLKGQDLAKLSPRQLRPLRKSFQMVFQDPVSSLNPSRTVGESIEAPLRAMGWTDARERRVRAEAMLAAVGLDAEAHFGRYPQQLSGGQCQRVSIARALITEPELLVCDEPVSSLDVSVQAQILNLLREIKNDLGLGVLFIGHDLVAVKNICDRVAVMYLGMFCEIASTAQLYDTPAHPYTAALLAAAPRPDPLHPLDSPKLISGELPSPLRPPSGCRFRTRCLQAESRCSQLAPELREIAPGHRVACHFPAYPPDRS